MSKFLTWIYEHLPLYSWKAMERANGAGYYDGFQDGCHKVGVRHGEGGRFISVNMPRKSDHVPTQPLAARPTLGTLFSNDEALEELGRVESPRR